MTENEALDLRNRLRAALKPAMMAKDRPAVDALRSALGAIDNAEAVAAPAGPGGEPGGEIAGASAGAGSSDVARRQLAEDDVRAIVEAEIAGLLAAVEEYENIGQAEAAADLRRGAQALEAAFDVPDDPSI